MARKYIVTGAASGIGMALAGAGIPLNVVGPGVIETPMIAAIPQTEEGMAAVRAAAPSPLNGPTAPASAPAELLAWLTSEQNTHVTGQSVYILTVEPKLSDDLRWSDLVIPHL